MTSHESTSFRLATGPLSQSESPIVRKRKLDDAGASEINRLYPESRRKIEKERPISEFTPSSGGGWRRERPRDELEESHEGENGRAQEGGLNSPKMHSRSTKNAVGRRMLLFFFCSRNGKEKSLQGETYRRHSRWNEAGASLTLIPVLMRGKCV
ncbi:hypothetical protein TNCV_2059861 [Trichonephila clavipes]|nr:hypothetical protein TNCV_2059861 [Trichonephila clavipes]